VLLSKSMRISELSRITGLTVPTIKYYIREGLLPAGMALSATQAEYDRSHVDRLRLIRALVEVGRLSITTVSELLATLDAPPDNDPGERLARSVATAHRALSGPPVSDASPPERALAAMATLGWQVDPHSAALRELESALAALEAVQLPPGEDSLRMYAEAALTVAEAEVNGVPTGSPAETVRYVVIGTVMYEPVLIALRRLAQQHVFTELSSRPRR
jgi:DNA-binding transcriptional MerR regulator